MIGVVGPESEAARLADAAEAAGESALAGDASDIAEAGATRIVAVGASALADVVQLDADAPVLPVDAGPEFETPAESPETAIERLLAGDYESRGYPVLETSIDGSPAGRALFDVSLDTEEPGRISEYRVEAGGSSDRFRADGVVVATPVGSRGYANAAGGPRLDEAVDAVSTVPIAAFAFDADPRVVEPPVTLTVERDECQVTLLADGRDRETVRPGATVEVSFGGEVPVLEPRPGLEKH